MHTSKNDINILRQLAKQKVEFAKGSANAERITKWKSINDLNMDIQMLLKKRIICIIMLLLINFGDAEMLRYFQKFLRKCTGIFRSNKRLNILFRCI